MRVEYLLFGVGALVFAPIGLIYGWLTDWAEPVGLVSLLLLSGLAGLTGLFFFVTSRRIDARPEDDPLGEIADGAGDYGVFSPSSWWPLVLGIAAGLIFLGAAVGWWISGIGGVLGIIGLVGLLFEFSRGQHAH
ncbi:putative integral membrane protein [Beutenbergia cavernae DSM 12333]|uniref:Cytochrome c oxidase polypeptide 4 n=1 Tax=Beutenbergia cavernae (strain ATCC BAA-8 / DSM 12333 / CCUG 43141 / JCM 11478 / NBRC 16432 / NCIMB 13614 / HKI 0122) TaxID=471853 RepID=C5C515_BEUC1|nr:cytochrome c oxidase subunit 4 [Beutenbergia cavernae]ACQ80143.1 putative integral membrane protein [Beutenbergia cavernae DSM 12333]